MLLWSKDTTQQHEKSKHTFLLEQVGEKSSTLKLQQSCFSLNKVKYLCVNNTEKTNKQDASVNYHALFTVCLTRLSMLRLEALCKVVVFRQTYIPKVRCHQSFVHGT